jgi:hypothetical protein
MATSGTWNFTLDIPDIIEEAYQRAGSELRSGWDYRTARLSLDLLLLEWQNRGLNLWTVKNASQALTASTASYTLSAEKLDIIEASLRTDEGDTTAQADLTMRRLSVSDYARQTNKLSEGRPSQYFVEYTDSAITVYPWPVPDSSTYTFNYWYIERIEDTGKPGTNNVDVPARFLPVLTAGLAYYIAMKLPESSDRLQMLQLEYERQWDLAADAARDKASFFMKPFIGGI